MERRWSVDDTASSAVNSSATATFPTLSIYQHDLLSRIIDRLPSEGAAWTDLLSSYQDVLQKDGLDISDHDDADVAVCYSALLKLGWQTGSSWRDKWASVQPKLGEGGYRISERARDGEKSSTSSLIRARRREEETSSEDDAVMDQQHQSNEARISQLKARLSEVMHSPTFASPPASTSVSLMPSQRRQETNSTRPQSPPRFVPPSSTAPARRAFLVQSPREEDPSSDEEGRAFESSSSRSIFNSTHRSRSIARPAPHDDSSPTKRRSIIPDPSLPSPELLHRELQFVELRDSRRKRIVFERWETSTAANGDEQARASQAYDMLLARKALRRWRQRVEDVDAMEENAILFEREMQARHTARSFSKWKHTIQDVRRSEWEKRMQIAWDYFRLASRKSILRTCFKVWRSLSLEARALRFREDSLVRSSLSKWNLRLSQITLLNDRADQFAHRDDDDIMYNTFDHWFRSARLQESERAFAETMGGKRLKSCMKIWCDRLNANKVADNFRTKLSLKIWQRKHLHVNSLQLSCSTFISSTDTTVLRNSLNFWIVECAGKLLEQSLRQSRSHESLKSSFMHWRSQQEVCNVLAQASVSLIERRRIKTLQLGFSSWRSKTNRRIALDTTASIIHDRSLAMTSMKEWRGAMQSRRVTSDQADLVRQRSLQRRVLSRFVLEYKVRKQQAWVAARNRKEVQCLFAEWLSRTRRVQTENRSVDAMQSRIEKRSVSHILTGWHDRTKSVKAMSLQAIHVCERKVKESMFSQWIGRTIDHAENLSLAESSWAVSQQVQQSKLLWRWIYATRQAEYRRTQIDQLVLAKDRKLVAAVWENWQDLYNERILHDTMVDFVAQRRERLVREKWMQWQDRTSSLPAIRFHSSILKHRCFNQWKALVPDGQLVLRANGMDRRRTLNQFFQIWNMRFRSQRAKQAANRFRALTTSPAVTTSSRDRFRAAVARIPASSTPAHNPAPFSRSRATIESPSPSAHRSAEAVRRRLTRVPSDDESSSSVTEVVSKVRTREAIKASLLLARKS